MSRPPGRTLTRALGLIAILASCAALAVTLSTR